jgi:uracil-DNA glycosylase
VCQSFVQRLAGARIGATFNQYAEAPELRTRLRRYLEARADAPLLLVGEAAGYRGARISGIPFTSERQLTGVGPGEATATIVHRVLGDLGVEEHVLLWNLVPTHPHRHDEPHSNRRPTADEVRAGSAFLEELANGKLVIAVGRLAESALGPPAVRHPSHGGAEAFREGLARLV